MQSSLRVYGAPSALHRCLAFSYLSALKCLIGICGSLLPLNDNLTVIAAGIHARIYMTPMGEEYVCMVNAVYLADKQVIMTHSLTHTMHTSVRLMSFPCHAARYNHQVGMVLDSEKFEREAPSH